MDARIKELCAAYEKALCDEIEKQEALMNALVEAYARGVIDGKNAEARKLQEFEFAEAEQHAFDIVQAHRKAIEAEIGLTKAFWYSQWNENKE